MSFLLSVHTKEGVVIASSRRNNNSFLAHNKKALQKCVYVVFNSIGIAIYSKSLYDYENLLESFSLLNHNNSLTVTTFTLKFFDFLKDMELQSEICFHIAGFEKHAGKNKPILYKINYPDGEISELNNLNNYTLGGADWVGDDDILTKLLKPLFTIDVKGNKTKLPDYSMPWQLFNLEEAVDFAHLAIKTAIQYQLQNNSCAVEVSPIDLLVITPKKIEQRSFNNPNTQEHQLVHSC